MARNVNRLFTQMVDDMHAMAPTDDILGACMSLSESVIRRVPLRYRIIALGFVKGLSLETLNEKLAQYGCPRLYSRNFLEATLIFAFMHGHSYDQWRQMQAQCSDICQQLEASDWFRDSKITFAELKRYVQQNSREQGDMLATQQRTMYLERALSDTGDDLAALRDFLTANHESFSSVRERTRYYFCKYLYYYLERRIDNYFDACRRGRGVEQALSEMSALKVVTQLRRRQTLPEDQKRALIEQSALSCGELFDAFNYFYFGYVSDDWAQILLECYERPADLPERQRKALAEHFRARYPEWKDRSDIDVIRDGAAAAEKAEDDAYALDGSRGYGKNRAGELTLYRYIQGTLDIDRTVLICFLLFFASDARMPQAHQLTVERLNAMLNRCGYAALDVERDFDWFAAEFLESRHPLDFLDEVVVEYAHRQENSFLYHLYGNAVQYQEELRQVMLPKAP